MEGIIAAYLRALRSVFNELVRIGSPELFTGYAFIPSVAIVFMAATAAGWASPSVALIGSLTIAIASHCRRPRELLAVGRPVALLSIAALVVSIPLIIGGGVGEPLFFVYRVSCSAASLALIARSVGWRTLLEGLALLRIPQGAVAMAELTARFIPLFMSDTLKLLVARSARSIGDMPLISRWRLLGSVVGELILKGVYRAGQLRLAVEARSLGMYRRGVSRRPRLGDVAVITLASVTALFYFLEIGV